MSALGCLTPGPWTQRPQSALGEAVLLKNCGMDWLPAFRRQLFFKCSVLVRSCSGHGFQVVPRSLSSPSFSEPL